MEKELIYYIWTKFDQLINAINKFFITLFNKNNKFFLRPDLEAISGIVEKALKNKVVVNVHGRREMSNYCSSIIFLISQKIPYLSCLTVVVLYLTWRLLTAFLKCGINYSVNNRIFFTIKFKFIFFKSLHTILHIHNKNKLKYVIRHLFFLLHLFLLILINNVTSVILLQFIINIILNFNC